MALADGTPGEAEAQAASIAGEDERGAKGRPAFGLADERRRATRLGHIWSALTRQRFSTRRLVAARLATALPIWPRQVAAWESGDKSPHSKKLLLFLAR